MGMTGSKIPACFAQRYKGPELFALLLSFYKTLYAKRLFVSDVNGTISSPLLSQHDSEV